MADLVAAPKASVGFFSRTGPRDENEDFAGAVLGAELPEPRGDVVGVIADGIGGAKGGRVAAEMAVRGFLDGFCDLPETMSVQRAAAVIVNSLNTWLHSQGLHDPKLAGMGCTLTALILRGRIAHILHVGDTRAYRLSGERLNCLTVDHVRKDGAGRPGNLYRALGVEPEVKLDYTAQPMALHDRFLLCSDGVHGFLTDDSIAEIFCACDPRRMKPPARWWRQRCAPEVATIARASFLMWSDSRLSRPRKLATPSRSCR